MSTVQEIENAITELPMNEIDELLGWLAEYHAELWDRQIEEDAKAGRLDAVVAEAEREYKAGLAKPL